MLGPIGIVLVAADLRRVILRDARLHVPEEYEAAAAAVELYEGHPQIDRSDRPDNPYPREFIFLKRRLQCLVMEDGSTKLMQAIQKAKDAGGAPLRARADAVQDRCEDVRRRAREQKRQYERLFPLTDYFVVDLKGPAGHIGVKFESPDDRDVDEARRRGVEADTRARLLRAMEGGDARDIARERTETYDALVQEYEALLEDGAALLEQLGRRMGR